MANNAARSHLLLVPLVLLVVVFLEDLAAYEVRRRVSSVHVRVAITMVLYGFGFAFAVGYVAPWLKRVLLSTRDSTRMMFGYLGFYALAYAGLYYVYYLMETRGGAPGVVRAAARAVGWKY